MKKWLLLVLSVGVSMGFVGHKKVDDHPIHVTKTTLNFKTSEKALQITLHFYCDDIEFEIQQSGKPNLRLNTPYEKPETSAVLLDYFRNQLTILLDGKPVELTWLGKERDGDYQGANVYMEVKNVKKFKTLEIGNRMLFSLYRDQKNIVEVTRDGNRIGYEYFDKSKQTKVVSF